VNAGATLAQDEAFARIRLLRSPNIGPVSYAQLLRRFGDAQATLAAPSSRPKPRVARRSGEAFSKRFAACC
jgi:DNA processing protein